MLLAIANLRSDNKSVYKRLWLSTWSLLHPSLAARSACLFPKIIPLCPGTQYISTKEPLRRAARVYTCSVHEHQAAEPSSPASPAPLYAHVPTTNQENVRMVLPLGRETAAVRHAQKLAWVASQSGVWLSWQGACLRKQTLLRGAGSVPRRSEFFGGTLKKEFIY